MQLGPVATAAIPALLLPDAAAGSPQGSQNWSPQELLLKSLLASFVRFVVGP